MKILNDKNISICINKEFKREDVIAKLNEKCLNENKQKLGNLNKDLVDKHEEGLWHGWVKLHKLNEIPENDKFYVKIDKKSGISIGKDLKANNSHYNLEDIQWICKNNIGCSIEKYANIRENDKDYEKNILKGVLNVKEGSKSCFVIGFYEKVKIFYY